MQTSNFRLTAREALFLCHIGPHGPSVTQYSLLKPDAIHSKIQNKVQRSVTSENQLKVRTPPSKNL